MHFISLPAIAAAGAAWCARFLVACKTLKDLHAAEFDLCH